MYSKKIKCLSVGMPIDLMKKLEKAAKKENRSKSKLAAIMIARALESLEQEAAQ